MLTNLIFLIAVLFSLLFVGLLWLREALRYRVAKLVEHEALIRKDLHKQRDMLPLALEGLREAGQTSDAWRKIVEDRAQFHFSKKVEEELAFSLQTLEFLKNQNARALAFLEAKKDIEELAVLIEKERSTLRNLALSYNEERKRFPYSLASAIFGLRDVALL